MSASAACSHTCLVCPWPFKHYSRQGCIERFELPSSRGNRRLGEPESRSPNSIPRYSSIIMRSAEGLYFRVENSESKRVSKGLFDAESHLTEPRKTSGVNCRTGSVPIGRGNKLEFFWKKLGREKRREEKRILIQIHTHTLCARGEK